MAVLCDYKVSYVCTNICRFVNEDGVSYNPVRSLSEPYGGEDIFTGPKV